MNTERQDREQKGILNRTADAIKTALLGPKPPEEGENQPPGPEDPPAETPAAPAVSVAPDGKKPPEPHYACPRSPCYSRRVQPVPDKPHLLSCCACGARFTKEEAGKIKPDWAKPAAPGICCPSKSCQSRRVEVARTVPHKKGIKRYRKCLACGWAWSTYEE